MPTLACFTVNRDTGVTLAAVSAAFFILYTTTLMLVARSATLHRLLVCAALAGLTHLWCATLDWVVLLPSPRVDMVTLSWVACASAAEAVFVSRIDASQLLLDVKGGGTGSVVPRRRSRARSFPGIGLGAGSAAGGGAPARPTRPGEGGEWWLLGWRALCVFFNLRRVGTRWEPGGVRRSSLGSAAGARDRGRLRFVLAMASRCVLCYLAVDLIGLFPRPEAHLITRDKQTLWRLWDLSAEDVGFRLSATAGIWITSYLFQTFNVSLAGLIAVGAGLSNPETWPPVFGPLWTMYSIRGFWGTFWHQSLRKAITGWADYVSDDLLRMARGTLASRYTRLLLAFLFSGMLHLGQDRVYGLGAEDISSPTFFCLQALAIMVEDGLRAMTDHLPIPRPVRRAIGYVWTVAWLWWITPLWMYPILRKEDLGSNVPFSFVNWALE